MCRPTPNPEDSEPLPEEHKLRNSWWEGFKAGWLNYKASLEKFLERREDDAR